MDRKMLYDSDYFKITHNHIKPKRGCLLISEPFSQDILFKRSVILLTEYSEDGAVGFILNKPVNIKLTEVLSDFPFFDAPISIGGPVNTDTIHYLHTLGDQLPNSVCISENIYWGGDFNTLKQLIDKKKINNQQIRFFLGYAGWSPKQLDNEIKENYWVVSQSSTQTIMTPQDNIWKTCVNNLGSKYNLWLNYPEDPNSN